MAAYSLDTAGYPDYQIPPSDGGARDMDRTLDVQMHRWKAGERKTQPWQGGEERYALCSCSMNLALAGAEPLEAWEGGGEAFSMEGASVPVLTVERIRIPDSLYPKAGRLFYQLGPAEEPVREMLRTGVLLELAGMHWPDELAETAMYASLRTEDFFGAEFAWVNCYMGYYRAHGQARVYTRYFLSPFDQAQDCLLVFTFCHAWYDGERDAWELYLTEEECEEWMRTLRVDVAP